MRFVVPAHNESAGIAATVRRLLGVDCPNELVDLVVVADNCSDETPEHARRAGAMVPEGQNAELRGKGYALDFAFSALPEDGIRWCHQRRHAGVAEHFACVRLWRELGAHAAHAAQADYARSQSGCVLAHAPHCNRVRQLSHRACARAASEFRVACGAKECVSAAALLKEVPHNAYSVVEDVDTGCTSGRRAIA